MMQQQEGEGTACTVECLNAVDACVEAYLLGDWLARENSELVLRLQVLA
jgi:hypothetical protein